MPTTYSINLGTVIETTRKTDIFKVLQDLPDNTQKLISPRDVRDAFLTTWANSSFKVTSPGALATEYIGLDSGDPSNRDIKQKILLGKRSVGNLDVMNNTLLSSTTADIFLFNTKSDSVSQASTKVSILAGTSSILHPYAPYFESFATGSNIDFNIHNPSLGGGAINIISTAGRVAINGIVFPTVAETTANASNGRILKYAGTYPNGYLIWADPTLTLTSIGSPTMSTELWGSPVTVNGVSLEFSDDSIVPVDVGGLTAGMSFSADSFYNSYLGTYSDWPMSEIIRRILYPYKLPVLQLSVSNNGTKYIEAGLTTSLTFTYSIKSYARNSGEWIRDYIIRKSTQSSIPFIFYGASFSGSAGATISGSFQYSTMSSVGILTYSLHISTQSSPFATSSAYPFGYTNVYVQDSIEVVNPILFGYSNVVPAVSGTAISDVNSVLSSMNRTILPYPGTNSTITIAATGSGYVYFMYPSNFTTDPVRVLDPNGFVIHDSELFEYDFFHASQVTVPAKTLFNNIIRDIDVDSNGKIYAIGSQTTYSGSASKYITRLNVDGTIDNSYFAGLTSFSGGTGTLAGRPLAFTRQVDDMFIFVGNFTLFNGQTASRIARLDTNGNRDTSYNYTGTGFNTNFQTTFPIKNFITHDSGSTWIVGNFTTYNGTAANKIVKLNSSGNIDGTFIYGSGITGTPYCVYRQTDGKLIVGGSSTITTYNGSSVKNIFRVTSSGSIDGGFTVPTNGFIGDYDSYFGDVFVIKQQSDGKLIVGGLFDGYGTNACFSICRLNTDGTFDNTFTGPFTVGLNRIYDIYIQSDGKIIITGQFSITSGLNVVASNIARLNSDGSIDNSFNGVSERIPALSDTSGVPYGNSIVIESDGKILVGGKFTIYGTASSTPGNLYTRQNIARLESNGVLYKPPVNSFFGATTSSWLYGNNVLANPYSGYYKVWVSKQPTTYLANASFQFIF